MANFGFSIDTAANWASNNPTPNADEMCVESDTKLVKLGDGATAYNALSYVATDAALTGIYGDGSDGAVTISGTTTLTRDMFYNTLAVNSGGTLLTGGFRVYCKTSCTVNSGGVIHWNGLDASGTTGGLGRGTVSVGGGGAGGAGGTTNGTAGTGETVSLGGSGGAGGKGTGVTSAGGTVTAPSATPAIGSVRALPAAATGLLTAGGSSPFAVQGGGGGGGGGGDGTAGGGAGGGAGVVLLNARMVTNSGTISANGGAGVSATAGNRGGGGGGGGGVVIVNTALYVGTNPTANGGGAGVGFGTGTAGSAGAAGTVLVNVWA